MNPKKQVDASKPPPKNEEADKSSLLAQYTHLVQHNGMLDDPAQHEVLARLQALRDQLDPGTKGMLGGLFKRSAHARSLYIWGNVGRGKSMLMDLFYRNVPLEHKRRVHFHAFMQEVHAELHTLRQEKASDPVATLARRIADANRLLCFDELQATDVADATLLYRLFEGLFNAGVIIVSTSNHPPTTLYTGGVQRERFAKFIALIEEQMNVVALSSPADYRHLQMKHLQRVYFTPLEGADAFIAETLARICPDSTPHKDTFNVLGRKFYFTLYGDSIGRFTFAELCESALGPADYLAIANRLDTVILTGIPKLPAEKRNEAKRFVTLIDALYENKVKLICTAEAPPEEIYDGGDGSFEFKRTASRLAEMQSVKYLTG